MRSPVSWTVVQICKFIRAIFVARFTITLRLFMLCFEHRVQISTAIWQVVLKSKDLTLPGRWTTIPLSQCAVRPYSHREIKKPRHANTGIKLVNIGKLYIRHIIGINMKNMLNQVKKTSLISEVQISVKKNFIFSHLSTDIQTSLLPKWIT